MRKPVLTLAMVAVVVAACSGSASDPGSSPAERPPDQHHVPTPDPWFPTAAPPVGGGPDFEDPGVAPYVDPDEDEVSTFALDVDTASYTIAQRFIAEGQRPDPASVRVEEWVNAFDHDYPAPDDATFGIVADGAPTPFNDEGELLLRVGLQARDVRDSRRLDASLTFVIDTSGSMQREHRLEIVKDALLRLVDGLGPDDRVAVVTFGDDARVVLPPTGVDDRRTIEGAISELQPGGSTNLEAGLRLGYGLAREVLTENGIDRVVLASDGVANVGLVDPDALLETIRRDASAGIELVSVGVGMGDYGDALLERLADDGDGFYAYVDDRDEAVKLFTEDLTGTLQTVALDAKAQVEFDPDVVAAYRQLGYENRAIADDDFTDDGIDAGAIGAGHDVTALYAIRLRDDRPRDDRVATVRVRWTDPERGDVEEVSAEIRLGDLERSFHATDPSFRLDAIVAATAGVVGDDPGVRWLRLSDVAEVARAEAEDLPATAEVHDFLDLLDALASTEE